jgi:hypothetical protein
MLSIPREKHSPMLAAALPRAEAEAFLVIRDQGVATLTAADLRAAIRSGRAAGAIAAALAALAGAESSGRGDRSSDSRRRVAIFPPPYCADVPRAYERRREIDPR